MSARNTGLFILGTVTEAEVAQALAAWPDYAPEHFAGEEGPRVGHTTWHGQPITHVALRVFEVMGFRLLSEDPIPDSTDLEMVLGQQLSQVHPVVFVCYEDEQMHGGGVRFERGKLVYRVSVDGQIAIPARRTLEGSHPIADLDASEWIWPHASSALAGAFSAGFVHPPQDDDAIEAMVLAAKARPIPLVSRNPAPPTHTPRPADRKRDRLKRVLRGWVRR